MTKYCEILRLHSLGFSARNIALAVPCSRNTVSKVLKRRQKRGFPGPFRMVRPMLILKNSYRHRRHLYQQSECRIMPTFARN